MLEEETGSTQQNVFSSDMSEETLFEMSGQKSEDPFSMESEGLFDE